MLDGTPLDGLLIDAIRNTAAAVEAGGKAPAWRTEGFLLADRALPAARDGGAADRRSYLYALARLVGLAVGEIRRVQALPAEHSLDARKGGEDAA